MRRSGLNDIATVVLGIALLFAGCGGSPPATTSEPPASPAASTAPSVQPSPLNDFDRALQFIRNGQYTYVWVFSRKDGKPLNSEDSDFLRTNAFQVLDWAANDAKTKVIAGTNFDLEEGNMEKLRKRFVVEDYSGR